MSKGCMMVLNRRHQLRSKYGHTIGFEPDVPSYVPPIVYSEAVAIGATRVDGEPANVVPEAVVAKVTQPDERPAVVLAVIKRIVEKNDPDDFTAGGKPTVPAVTAEAGFKVDVKEIIAAWQAYHDEKAATAAAA